MTQPRTTSCAVSRALFAAVVVAGSALAGADDELAWRPLFDGETLAGWKLVGEGAWVVEDGRILGTHAEAEPGHGLLISEELFGDFSLRLQVRATQGNSGVYFRVEQGGGAGVRGFQAEIDTQKNFGGLYETAGRGWVVKTTATRVSSRRVERLRGAHARA